VLRIDAPPANAVDLAVVAGLEAAAVRLRAHPVPALVVTGGTRAFSSGVDPAALVVTDAAGAVRLDEGRASTLVGRLGSLLHELERLPFPTAAAIEGLALGGGLELALACDLRVVGESSRLGLPEARLGVLPAGGATQRLPRLVGRSHALELLASGRTMRPPEALHLGLVDRVAPRGDALAVAAALVRAVAHAQHDVVRLLGTGRVPRRVPRTGGR
jgi:enoyl-CoA hydratase/carnithine racemase